MESDADVIVVGAGCAGTSAALAAARNGARTLLIERAGFLGGTSTAVLDTFYAMYTPGEHPQKVVGGIADEVVERLRGQGGVLVRPNTFGSGTGITYSQEGLKRVWDDLVVESGASVRLHTMVCDARVVTDGVRLTVASKAGLREVRAGVVVDASGDADVTSMSGGRFELAGRDGPQQTMTVTFRVGGVDTTRAFDFGHDQLHRWMREANAGGTFKLPREEGSAHRTPMPGVVLTIMTRVPGVDPTDIEGQTAAELEGRRQAGEYFRFLKERVPGYEAAYLDSTSPWIGVRETRRIIGDYVLQAEDVLAARQFADAIARCGAPIEDHHQGRDTRWQYIPDGGTYGIPFRCLLPVGIDSVVVAGRCLSATHDAHASARSMGTCMAMGQAAGTAAALAVGLDCTPRDVDIDLLQERLDRQGADFGQAKEA